MITAQVEPSLSEEHFSEAPPLWLLHLAWASLPGETGERVRPLPGSLAVWDRVSALQSGLGWVTQGRVTQAGAQASSRHWRDQTPPRAAQSLGLQAAFAGARARPAILDLFCGAGGLGLGFEQAGFEVTVGVELDPQAAAAHRINAPHARTLQEDIGQVSADPAAYGLRAGDFAGIVGGPPCQGFSQMGERHADDARNDLGGHFLSLVRQLQPQFFVMENVTGMLTAGQVLPLGRSLPRLSSATGETASALIASLPESEMAARQRSRQWLKRLISGILASRAAQLKVEVAEGEEAGVPLVRRVEGRLRADLECAFRLATPGATPESGSAGYLSSDTEMVALGSLRHHAGLVWRMALGLVSSVLVDRGATEAALRELLDQLLLDSLSGTHASALLESLAAAGAGRRIGGVMVGPVLSEMIAQVEENYDIAPPQVLCASQFGVPQRRKRLFVVGIRRDLLASGLAAPFSYPQPRPDQVIGTGPALADLPDVDVLALDGGLQGEGKDQVSRAHLTSPAPYAAALRLDTTGALGASRPPRSWNPLILSGFSQTRHDDRARALIAQVPPGGIDRSCKRARLHPERPGPTLRAGTREGRGSRTAVRPLHWRDDRVITVREGARLMGFPDWMTFHHTRWHGHRLVGNGVPAPLARAVASQVLLSLGREPAAD